MWVSGLKILMKTKIHSVKVNNVTSHIILWLTTTDTDSKSALLFAITNWLQQKFVCSRLPWLTVAYIALTHNTACWLLRLEIQSTVKEANIYLAAAAKS